MARFLTGTAIGLVLGGGGARGCAHVGMIQAMHEAGIPIDLIGGTSIGAFMGALWADELNVHGYIDRARDWCKVKFNEWIEIPFSKPMLCLENDIFLEKTSWSNVSHYQHVHRFYRFLLVFDEKNIERRSILGAAFNELIEEALPDVQIEDLWIPYFCITTDISASKMRVHTTGRSDSAVGNAGDIVE